MIIHSVCMKKLLRWRYTKKKKSSKKKKKKKKKKQVSGKYNGCINWGQKTDTLNSSRVPGAHIFTVGYFLAFQTSNKTSKATDHFNKLVTIIKKKKEKQVSPFVLLNKILAFSFFPEILPLYPSKRATNVCSTAGVLR